MKLMSNKKAAFDWIMAFTIIIVLLIAATAVVALKFKNRIIYLADEDDKAANLIISDANFGDLETQNKLFSLLKSPVETSEYGEIPLKDLVRLSDRSNDYRMELYSFIANYVNNSNGCWNVYIYHSKFERKILKDGYICQGALSSINIFDSDRKIKIALRGGNE